MIVPHSPTGGAIDALRKSWITSIIIASDAQVSTRGRSELNSASVLVTRELLQDIQIISIINWDERIWIENLCVENSDATSHHVSLSNQFHRDDATIYLISRSSPPHIYSSSSSPNSSSSSCAALHQSVIPKPSSQIVATM